MTESSARHEFLTPAEVTAQFQVNPKTVTRWAKAGKLSFVRTPGGHRRYLREDVMKLVAGEKTLTPGQVGRMFSVDPKTVTRWANEGKLSAVKTLGGHRRYLETEVRELLDQEEAPKQ